MTESKLVYMPKDLYIKTLDEVRAKTKTTEKINAKDLPDKIQGIKTGVTIGQLNAEEYPEKVIFNGKYIGDVLQNAGNINYFEAPNITEMSNSHMFYKTYFNKVYFPKLETIKDRIGPELNFLRSTKIDEESFPVLEKIYDPNFFQYAENAVEINLPKLKYLDNYGTIGNMQKIKNIFLPNLSIRIVSFEYMPNLETLFVPKIKNFSKPPIKCPKVKEMFFNNDSLSLYEIPNQLITGDIDTTTGEVIKNDYHLSTYILNTTNVVYLEGVETDPNKRSKIVKFYVRDELLDQYKSATNWSLIPDMIKPISELPPELKEKYKEYL